MAAAASLLCGAGGFLLGAQPAQALSVECALIKGRETVEAFRKKLVSAPQVGAQKGWRDSQLLRAMGLNAASQTCKVVIGEAKLGGRTGALLTSIGPKEKLVLVFCIDSIDSECLVRIGNRAGAKGEWHQGAVTMKPAPRQRFVYLVESVSLDHESLVFLGPDIRPFLSRKQSAGTRSASMAGTRSPLQC